MDEKIIDEIPVEALKAELTPERRLRSTNKGGNEIYVVDGREAPNVMREIGRLPEIAFRSAGGGTGKACDIDDFDVMDPPCRQLLVWDPENNLILGGYRFITGRDVRMVNGQPRIATSHMFDFSQRFIDEFLPNTLELGRSFVRPRRRLSTLSTIYGTALALWQSSIPKSNISSERSRCIPTTGLKRAT